MKQFEKWLQNHKHANWTWEEDARESWRAALMGILEECRHYQSQKVINFILEELKDETKKT